MKASPQDRVIVVGGGIAGLAAALQLAPLPVMLIVASPLGEQASTPLAQGGIAAALGEDDAPVLHAEDTLRAGAGLSDAGVAERVARAAPSCVEWLVTLGAPFDRRESEDRLILGLEAAHSRRRIVHAGGDRTGKRVLEILIQAARETESIQILEETRVTDLVLDYNRSIAGVLCLQAGMDKPFVVIGRAVILATGGIGGLSAHTTNPLSSTGAGLAIAARAGAVLRDLEFVQFHPTAIAVGLDPMPLATEALRGEGAVLINGRGERFMQDIPGAELAPRDVVARTIFAQILAGERVFLDTRETLGETIQKRFPGVAALCKLAGIDPVLQPIPVRPAAHYHMGGIKVDSHGRSSIEGLWACGEVASTGLHGANRLASNSLLEALAYARWIAEDVKSVIPPAKVSSPSTRLQETRRPRLASPRIRQIMDQQVGVLREASGLSSAIRELRAMLSNETTASNDAALVSLLIATTAYRRRESRGAHQRRDYPGQIAAKEQAITLDEALRIAAQIDRETTEPARRVA
ncbi:L-aspartate oxidase [Microvirga terricola]|uniref:L-aspartate oxidase n=1 Tax=Microvirga terricola TaxID=2719797 RepID=A0ABX0VID9_9HYPH|nr:L-aspartate oxidase [Microvirga terricola]NIX78357.1 L-aspartate oxidase [Microvirga terricola]